MKLKLVQLPLLSPSVNRVNVPLGARNLQLVLGRVVLARLERKHLHLLLEGQLLRHRFGLLLLLLLGQPAGAGVTTTKK